MAVQQLAGDELSTLVYSGVPDSLVGTGVCDGVIWVKPTRIFDVCAFLKSDSGLDFDFLNSICFRHGVIKLISFQLFLLHYYKIRQNLS